MNIEVIRRDLQDLTIEGLHICMEQIYSNCFYFNLNGDGKFVGVGPACFDRIWQNRGIGVIIVQEMRRQTSRRRNERFLLIDLSIYAVFLFWNSGRVKCEIVEVACALFWQVLGRFNDRRFIVRKLNTYRIEHVACNTCIYEWQTSRRRNVWFLLIDLSIYGPVSIFIRTGEIGNASERWSAVLNFRGCLDRDTQNVKGGGGRKWRRERFFNIPPFQHFQLFEKGQILFPTEIYQTFFKIFFYKFLCKQAKKGSWETLISSIAMIIFLKWKAITRRK